MNASTGFSVIIDPIYVTHVELEDACSLLAAFPHCQQYWCDYAAAMTAYEGASR
jgi:hypothetical protein